MNIKSENPTEPEPPLIDYNFEDPADYNRRIRYETAYPQVSVLFDEETVLAMNWKAVFGF